jgi:hypothetical protein
MTDVYQNLFDRLFYFFRNDPHTLKLLTVLADPIQDTRDALDFMLGSDSIDTAEGEQLEFLGSLIGVSRPPAQELDENIFTLCRLGETDDLDGSTGFFDDTDSVELGGYLTTLKGLPSITQPGTEMPDEEYRRLIRQKAAMLKSKMTVENLFNYLIAFGSKCKIDDDTRYICEIDPFTYYDLNEWFKYYVETKGFKPAAFTPRFADNLRHGDSI